MISLSLTKPQMGPSSYEAPVLTRRAPHPAGRAPSWFLHQLDWIHPTCLQSDSLTSLPGSSIIQTSQSEGTSPFCYSKGCLSQPLWFTLRCGVPSCVLHGPQCLPPPEVSAINKLLSHLSSIGCHVSGHLLLCSVEDPSCPTG